MTGALSRLTKDSIVTTNFHSNNVQGMSERSGRASTYPRGAIGPDMREKQAIYFVARLPSA